MTNFRKARSRSGRSAARVAAGVAVLFVCFQSSTNFFQIAMPTTQRTALRGRLTAPTVSLAGTARGEGLPRFAGGASFAGDAIAVTEADVLQAQDAWKAAIVRISKEYLANPQGEKFKNVAKEAASELYGYGEEDVLFKPTKAKAHPFRETGESALSYFIGYDAVKPNGFTEDQGFAINGGKGWKAVSFDNSKISLFGNVALAQGIYHFTDFSGETAQVEYSFGYKKMSDGSVKIVLHHSSIPYSP
eukprot:TRINITY_DN5206_c0_g1_i6.p1 TRINITY_DN5206_c0_g1~~TRINITY_DN5206_c0_g1_i6.p1  ORF type:complete len:246 (-),score=39.57 TRINITY_DN5206_c0_g1_i6:230-967(-)